MTFRAPRVAAGLLVVAAVVLTLGPPDLRPHLGRPSVERFLAFAVIGAALGLALPRHRLAVLLAIVGCAGLLEALQAWIPDRHAELRDFAAKTLGACVGVGAAALTAWAHRSFRGGSTEG